MQIRHGIVADHNAQQTSPVCWCPTCHELQEHGSECVRCGPASGQLIALGRGLASLDVAGEYGLVRYQGDQITTIVGLALVLMLPTSAALALAGDVSVLSSLVLGLCFVGVPVLAFVDAQRAGAALRSRTIPMPDMLASDMAVWTHEAGTPAMAREYGVTLSGVVNRVDRIVRAPVSDTDALAYRMDIRCGRHAELVARRTLGVDFLLSCGNGGQVLVTGVIELVASRYRAVDLSSAIELDMSGTRLLPAQFRQGGWACELFICAGDVIEVQAPPSHEKRVHPLGAGYRSTAFITVLRGTPSRPLILRVSNQE